MTKHFKDTVANITRVTMDHLLNLVNEKNDYLRPCLVPVLVNAIQLDEEWTFPHLEQLIQDLADGRVSTQQAMETYLQSARGSESEDLFNNVLGVGRG